MQTPFEQNMDADLGLIVEDASGLGIDCEILPEGAEVPLAPLRAMFEQPGTSQPLSPGHAPITSSKPVLHVQISRVIHALGRPLTTRDRLIVRGKTYRLEHPMGDGFGLVSLKLLEVKGNVKP